MEVQVDDEGPEVQGDSGGSPTREQRPGEGGTTRFGMEDGDNTDTPATGGPAANDDADQSGS